MLYGKAELRKSEWQIHFAEIELGDTNQAEVKTEF